MQSGCLGKCSKHFEKLSSKINIQIALTGFNIVATFLVNFHSNIFSVFVSLFGFLAWKSKATDDVFCYDFSNSKIFSKMQAAKKSCNAATSILCTNPANALFPRHVLLLWCRWVLSIIARCHFQPPGWIVCLPLLKSFAGVTGNLFLHELRFAFSFRRTCSMVFGLEARSSGCGHTSICDWKQVSLSLVTLLSEETQHQTL